MVVFFPFQIIYLFLLYTDVISGVTIDVSRLHLQATSFLPRFFWYGSFLWGLLLVLFKFCQKSNFIIFVLAIEALVLLLYGSKSLLIFPAFAALSLVFEARKLKITIRGILIPFGIIFFSIILSVLINNYRSVSGFFANESFLVDFFATLFPESRDGGFLICNGFEINTYPFLESTFFAILNGFTSNFLVKSIFGYDINYYTNQLVISVKDMLSMQDLEAINPRIGFLASIFIVGGYFGTLILTLFLSLFATISYYIIYASKQLYTKYFALLIYINLLWAFFSDFNGSITFSGYIFWFAIFFNFSYKIYLSITKSVTHA